MNMIMRFLIKPWKILSQPDQALGELRDGSLKDKFAYLALWSAWLGVLHIPLLSISIYGFILGHLRIEKGSISEHDGRAVS